MCYFICAQTIKKNISALVMSMMSKEAKCIFIGYNDFVLIAESFGTNWVFFMKLSNVMKGFLSGRCT